MTDASQKFSSDGLGPQQARAWIMWGPRGIAVFLRDVSACAPSAMVDDLMRSFDATAVIPGKLPAFFYWAYALVQIPVGVVVDK